MVPAVSRVAARSALRLQRGDSLGELSDRSAATRSARIAAGVSVRPSRSSCAERSGDLPAELGIVSAGADGWIDDDLAFVKPFGFEIDAITAPSLDAHGQLDLFVPVSHGEWLSRAVSGAESWILEDEAHLSPVPRHQTR